MYSRSIVRGKGVDRPIVEDFARDNPPSTLIVYASLSAWCATALHGGASVNVIYVLTGPVYHDPMPTSFFSRFKNRLQ